METRDSAAILEELYRSHAEDVFRFSLYLSGNWVLSQDLTSETFVRAWTASVPLQTSTAKGYLFAIARNLYLDSPRPGQRPQRERSVSLPAAPTASFEIQEELVQTPDDLK